VTESGCSESVQVHSIRVHPAILLTPAVEALGAFIVLAADLFGRRPGIRFAQDPDDLFGAVSTLFHR
jgi:hypothetical protein